MALPNREADKIKVFPDEYINNITINRPNLRLLENDKYLEGMISASPVPSGNSAPGEEGQWSIDENYVYFYVNDTWGWGRVTIDRDF